MRPARAHDAARRAADAPGGRRPRACTTTARASTRRCSRYARAPGWPTLGYERLRPPGAGARARAGRAVERQPAGRHRLSGGRLRRRRHRAPAVGARAAFARFGAAAATGRRSRRELSPRSRHIHFFRRNRALRYRAGRGDERPRDQQGRRGGRARGDHTRARGSRSRSRWRTVRPRAAPAVLELLQLLGLPAERAAARVSRRSLARRSSTRAARWSAMCAWRADVRHLRFDIATSTMTSLSANEAILTRSTRRALNSLRLAAILAAGTEAEMRTALEAAAKSAIDPVWVEELVLQTYLFAGFPRTLNGMRALAARVRARRARRRSRGDARDAVDAARRADVRDGVWVAVQAAARRTSAACTGARQLDDRSMATAGCSARPGLDLRRRELCIVAACAALEQDRQLHSHLHGALNAGATAEEIDDTLSHRRAAHGRGIEPRAMRCSGRGCARA